jgi:hypothetical protein
MHWEGCVFLAAARRIPHPEPRDAVIAGEGHRFAHGLRAPANGRIGVVDFSEYRACSHTRKPEALATILSNKLTAQGDCKQALRHMTKSCYPPQPLSLLAHVHVAPSGELLAMENMLKISAGVVFSRLEPNILMEVRRFGLLLPNPVVWLSLS